MTATTPFLGFRFARGTSAALRADIAARAHAAYGYVVTPNVDFVTRAAADDMVARLYDSAALQICDSRVLALLARLKGVTLDCTPGSDLVAALLASPGDLRIAAIGPGGEDWPRLTARFPRTSLALLPSGVMTRGDPAWHAAIRDAAALPWDVLLVCLGSPKQEMFAADLGAAGRPRGVALCVGASLDFLTGRQRRAPAWLRTLRLEWLHRLLGDPVRLWRRYLVDGPKIVRLLAKDASRDRR